MDLVSLQNVVFLKGTIWWKPESHNCTFVGEHHFKNISQLGGDMYKILVRFGYCDVRHNRIILLLDSSRFLNHSDTPNSGVSDTDPAASMTLRNIEKDEEITENYQGYGSLPWFPEHVVF